MHSYCLGGEYPAHYARERTYDVLHYRLNIDVNEKKKTCEGDVTISLLPLREEFDSLVLDAGTMSIDDIRLEGRAISHRHEGESLVLHLDKAYSLSDTLRLQISYSVMSPKKGLYFITPDSSYPNKHYQVWSQGQPEDNHFWFPCYDYPNDKATSEMIVTVSDELTAISNGTLIDVKKDEKNRTATFHWLERNPYSSYLISLVVGEYAEVQERWRSKPVSYYVYPEHKEIAHVSFGKTPDAVEFFSNVIGTPYPWGKYAQVVVQDFIYGGMENLSASTLSDVTIHDSRAHLDVSSDGLMAHELAHQWWGDLVTPRDWSHAWLSEGFASYFDMVFQEHDKGTDERDRMILDAHRSLSVNDVGKQRRPTVYNRYENVSDIYDNRIYGKGAAVLHMLRFTLGEELFWKSIRAYCEKFKFGLAETNDLKIAIEDATGYNLERFFRQWVYGAGFPEFHISKEWNVEERILRLTVKQTQTVDSLTGIFETPVDIQIWMNNKPVTRRIAITKPIEEIILPLPERPQLVLFDKGNRILKYSEVEQPIEEWVYQLRHAEDGVDRFLAVEKLRGITNNEEVARALSLVVINDPVWYIRQAAAYALGSFGDDSARTVLHSAYGDRDARVRSAVVASLGNFGSEESKKLILYAFEKDMSYYVAAAALQSLRLTDHRNIARHCMSALSRDSHHEVLRSAALNILAEEDSESLETIKSYARYGVARDLRVEALRILQRYWGDEKATVDYIIGFLNDPSFHVRRTAISLLGAIGDSRAVPSLQQSAATETDSRLVHLAQESLKKIQEVKNKGK